MLTHPGDFDAAVADDVIIDLGAALSIDAMAEGDVTAEQLALAVPVGPGPLGAEAGDGLGAVSRPPASAAAGYLLESGLAVAVVTAEEREEGQ